MLSALQFVSKKHYRRCRRTANFGATIDALSSGTSTVAKRRQGHWCVDREKPILILSAKSFTKWYKPACSVSVNLSAKRSKAKNQRRLGINLREFFLNLVNFKHLAYFYSPSDISPWVWDLFSILFYPTFLRQFSICPFLF